MFAVAVATRCNRPGDPVQTRHRGIRPMAAAAAPPLAGPVERHSLRGRGRGVWWEERTLLFCFRINMQRVGPAGNTVQSPLHIQSKYGNICCVLNMGIRSMFKALF